MDGHPIGAMLDPPHRGAEDQPLRAQPFRHPQRHELRAAHQPVLLGAALGVEEDLEAAGRVDVEEQVKERQLLGLGSPDRLDPQL
jgi:hypothetical protein